MTTLQGPSKSKCIPASPGQRRRHQRRGTERSGRRGVTDMLCSAAGPVGRQSHTPHSRDTAQEDRNIWQHSPSGPCRRWRRSRCALGGDLLFACMRAARPSLLCDHVAPRMLEGDGRHAYHSALEASWHITAPASQIMLPLRHRARCLRRPAPLHCCSARPRRTAATRSPHRRPQPAPRPQAAARMRRCDR